MPKTRTTLKRDEKVEQILKAAQHRLNTQGFEGLTMAGVARDLGLAQAAVYWYFPSRDHLFVAVLKRILDKILIKKKAQGLDLRGSILWFTEQLSSFAKFRAAIQGRARHSDVVAEFVRDFNSMLRAILRGALGPHVDERDLDVTIESFIATVEGTLVARMSPKERRRILQFTLERIIGDSR